MKSWTCRPNYCDTRFWPVCVCKFKFEFKLSCSGTVTTVQHDAHFEWMVIVLWSLFWSRG